MARFCPCGSEIGAMSNSVKCRACREKEKYEKRRQAGEKAVAEAKARGMVRLHSCISNILDPMPQCCCCRKWITFAEAEEYIRISRAVDALTRSAHFFQRAIVEKSRLKRPPISSIGQKIAIERTSEFNEKDVARLRAVAEEDKYLREHEQTCKIEEEHALAVEALKQLIVFVDEEIFEKAKAQSWGRPDRFATKEERTSVGRDVGQKVESIYDSDEFEQNDPTITTATQIAAPTEPKATGDIENLIGSEDALEEAA